ncbi:MAG: hypothetical protein ACTHOH_19030 [Lysobacteraceae bacterium]
MPHGIARSVLSAALMAATLAVPVAFPAIATAASVGSGGIQVVPPVGRGIWEGRIRIVHHYYDLQPDYTTYQSASGSTQAACNTALTAALSAAIAAEPTAQVDHDIDCYWHP